MEKNDRKGIQKHFKRILLGIFIIYEVFVNIFFLSVIIGYDLTPKSAVETAVPKASPTVSKEQGTALPTTTPKLSSTPRPTKSAEQIQEADAVKTQIAIDTINRWKESALEVEGSEFVDNTQKYVDAVTMVHIWGEVCHINTDHYLLIWIAGSDEVVHVQTIEPFEDIAEGDIIDVWGFVINSLRGENICGVESYEPYISAMILEKR